MKITIKGKLVNKTEAAAFLTRTWNNDGAKMLQSRIVDAREYAAEECMQPLSWMDGMEIKI